MALTTLQAAMSGVPFALQTAATTGAGLVLAIPPSFQNHTFIITAAAAVNAGAVTVETTNDPNDANTWAPIVADKSIANPLTVIASTDLLMPYSGRLNFVRARISTTISGGGAPAVTVNYLGAKSY
jgi:hypothetical protein